MAVEKIFKKMQAEQAYIALKLGKLKVFISSEDFGKFLSLEMQEIKKQQAEAMQAYVDALSKAGTQMCIENNGLNCTEFKSKGVEVIGAFNPDVNTAIDEIKLGAINLINDIEDLGKDPRRQATSFTDIEKGVMMAVKSLFE